MINTPGTSDRDNPNSSLLDIIEDLGSFNEVLRLSGSARQSQDWTIEGNFLKNLPLLDQSPGSQRLKRKIEVTIEELIVNSRGACMERDDLFIEVIIYFKDGKVVVYVKDDGHGFDHMKAIEEARNNPNELTDAMVLDGEEDESGLGLPGGTGMYCLLNYASRFQYGEKGKEVVVEFDV